MHEILQL